MQFLFVLVPAVLVLNCTAADVAKALSLKPASGPVAWRLGSRHLVTSKLSYLPPSPNKYITSHNLNRHYYN